MGVISRVICNECGEEAELIHPDARLVNLTDTNYQVRMSIFDADTGYSGTYLCEACKREIVRKFLNKVFSPSRRENRNG